MQIDVALLAFYNVRSTVYEWRHCARSLSIGTIISDHIQSSSLGMFVWALHANSCDQK